MGERTRSATLGALELPFLLLPNMGGGGRPPGGGGGGGPPNEGGGPGGGGGPGMVKACRAFSIGYWWIEGFSWIKWSWSGELW